MTTAGEFEVRSVGVGVDDDDGPAASTASTDGTWEVAVEWQRLRGRLEPTSVTVANVVGEPVRAAAIRQLPLGEIVSAMRTAIAEDALGLDGIVRPARVLAEVRQLAACNGPRRGHALTSDDLRELAEVYRAAWVNGESVNQAVQRTFHLSEGGASKRIMRARAAGLLDDVGPQRP